MTIQQLMEFGLLQHTLFRGNEIHGLSDNMNRSIHGLCCGKEPIRCKTQIVLVGTEADLAFPLRKGDRGISDSDI